MLVLAVGLGGLALLSILALRVRREVGPTVTVIDQFGRRQHLALLRLRDETARTRRQLRRD